MAATGAHSRPDCLVCRRLPARRSVTSRLLGKVEAQGRAADAVPELSATAVRRAVALHPHEIEEVPRQSIPRSSTRALFPPAELSTGCHRRGASAAPPRSEDEGASARIPPACTPDAGQCIVSAGQAQCCANFFSSRLRRRRDAAFGSASGRPAASGARAFGATKLRTNRARLHAMTLHNEASFVPRSAPQRATAIANATPGGDPWRCRRSIDVPAMRKFSGAAQQAPVHLVRIELPSASELAAAATAPRERAGGLASTASSTRGRHRRCLLGQGPRPEVDP